MNLTYAVERLLDTDWAPAPDIEIDRLPDGRRFPTVLGVKREFARCGLDLQIKQNLMFGCYRASWAPIGERLDSESDDSRHGTVIGTCEREAAVYALAQFRQAEVEQQLATV